MGYNKFIKSGNTIELYEYENELPERRNGNRKSKITIDREGLAVSGIDPLQRIQAFEKRRDNAQRASVAFKRIVSSNLAYSERPLLFTLTFNQQRESISECAKFFHIFTIRMRRSFGKEFRYVAVPEFQKSGRVHYHALFWDLPDGIQERERETRKIASLWEQGFVDIKKTDGNVKLAGYLAKYMAKAMSDVRLFGFKVYFGSRNLSRPITRSGFPDGWIDRQYDFSKFSVEKDDKYYTNWLGMGRYRKFVISNLENKE